ncbi:MAG: 50S ribosomal protein L9 [Aquificaceae bacterium]
MKVVLVQDYEDLGSFGDIINVKDGFARNYLIPRGIALPATDSNLKHISTIQSHKKRKLDRQKQKAINIANSINGKIFEIYREVGKGGKLYGSVGAMDIASALKEAGFEVERKQISLKSPIKDVGIYTIVVKLHPEVIANIKVDIKPSPGS